MTLMCKHITGMFANLLTDIMINVLEVNISWLPINITRTTFVHSMALYLFSGSVTIARMQLPFPRWIRHLQHTCFKSVSFI